MVMAPCGQAFTHEKHSQQASGSWLKAIPCSLLYALPRSASYFMRSLGQMYMQAVRARPRHPSHLSGFTKVGIAPPPGWVGRYFSPLAYLWSVTSTFSSSVA